MKTEAVRNKIKRRGKGKGKGRKEMKESDFLVNIWHTLLLIIVY